MAGVGESGGWKWKQLYLNNNLESYKKNKEEEVGVPKSP